MYSRFGVMIWIAWVFRRKKVRFWPSAEILSLSLRARSSARFLKGRKGSTSSVRRAFVEWPLIVAHTGRLEFDVKRS